MGRRVQRFLALIAVAALGASGARTPAADAGDEPKAAGGAHRCVVEGRIVDGFESGVSGATVAWIGDSPAGDRSTGEAIRTDDTGHFRLALGGPASEVLRGLLHATHGDDSAALAAIVVASGEREKDVGTLDLEPARALHVHVHRVGTAVRDARVWLFAGGVRSYEAVFVGTAATDPEGRAVFAPLPSLVLNLQAWGPDGSGGAAARAVVPGSAPTRVNIELGTSRTVDVLVTTDDSPPHPIAGATVSRRYGVWLGSDVATSVAADAPNRIAPTAADGHTRVDGLPADERLTIEARFPGRPRGRVECEPGTTSATIVIPKPTAIPNEDGETPRPPDGTKVVVWGRRTLRTAVEGWIEKGAIVLPLAPHEVDPGLAIAPDGSCAPLDGVEPTAFFHPRSLVVRIVEKDGRGVAGTRVSLSSSPYVEGPWDTPTATDDEGRVRFEGLAPLKHFIYGFPTASAPHGRRIGEVDLRPGDATLDVVVGAEATIVARVTVDGRPAVPERFRWTIAHGIVVDSAIDRTGGTVRIRARAEPDAPETGSIELGGKGVRPREVAFPWPARGGTTSVDVALFASPEVIVEVRADPGSDADVSVERWEVSSWNAKPWERGLWQRHAGPYQAGRIGVDLPAGRYRLRNGETGIVSVLFDVPDRGGRIVATLDLTGLVTIRGRVEGPAPADARSAQLVLDGEGFDTLSPGIPSGISRGLSYDGKSFTLRVPAGRRVTISPWHPSLQPAREGGAVTLVGPRDDVVLKMGAGATLVARLTDPDGRPLSADELRRVWITAIPVAHPSWAPEIGTVTPVAGEAGTVSASGLPFGTMDVWIQTAGFAARRLERATLASDRTDLGEVRLSRGSKMRLRQVRKDGTVVSAPRPLTGWAFATFGPRQIRDLEEGTGGIVGLCAGRWRVVVWAPGTEFDGAREEQAIEIDVDGEHDLTLDVDIEDLRLAIPK